MAVLTRAQLKALWVSLFKPFQTNYDDVWDSFIAPEDIPALDGMTNKFEFGGQAHGGSYIKAFSASATFNANDGNVQFMLITASTTINIINELPGTYVFKLKIDTVSGPTVNIGVSIGIPLPNASLDIDNADTVVNILTIVVDPNGDKDYTIIN